MLLTPLPVLFHGVEEASILFYRHAIKLTNHSSIPYWILVIFSFKLLSIISPDIFIFIFMWIDVFIFLDVSYIAQS